MIVCVYAIMRDEMRNVAAWAETTTDADRRFVLDTGSEDATVDELRLVHGITVVPATFSPFRFDDARNTALALAPGADLYLRLDADERLEPGWREQIEAVYAPEIGRYRYTVVNHGSGWGRHSREDLHVRQGQRWRYPTHEVLTGPALVSAVPGMVVHHHPGDRRPHHDTNLAVLQGAIHEYPGDHRMAFYFGRELWYSGDWVNARGYLWNFLQLPGGWNAERAEAYRIIAAIDDDPERWLFKAIGECPERREPWVDLARHYLHTQRFQEAGMALFAATMRNDDTIYTTDPRAWGQGFHDLEEEIAHHLADPMVAT